MARSIPTLSDTLKRHGYSNTQTRQAVFGALTDSGPLTMAQLVNKVHSLADRTSVYRTVDLFEKLGIINRLQIGWKYKLELSDLFTDHHHHVTCLQCGNVVSLDQDVLLEAKINKLAKGVHFHPTTHTLEVRGLCSACVKTP